MLAPVLRDVIDPGPVEKVASGALSWVVLLVAVAAVVTILLILRVTKGRRNEK